MKHLGLRAITIGFAAAVTILIITGSLNYSSMMRVLEAGQWVEHSDTILRTTADLSIALLDAEEGCRRFLASADPSALAEHRDAVVAVNEKIRALLDLTGDNPQQWQRLHAVEPIVAAKMSGLEERIELGSKGERQSPRQDELRTTGADLTSRIRGLLRDFEGNETTLLRRRRTETATSVRRTRVIRVIGGTISLAIIFWVFVLLRREVAERQQAEQQFQEANGFLDSVIENIPNMIFVKQAASLRFVRLNRAGEALLGCSRDELIGRSDHDLFPKEQADFFTDTDRLILRNKDSLDIAEEPIRTLHLGERVLHTKKVSILDRHGNPAYLLGISEDITERKYAQEQIERLNEVLAQRATQLEAANHELEAFSYSVSHDLRAPLRHMDGFVALLRKREQGRLDGTSVRYLNTIADAANKMGRLIDDLLAFSRTGRTELQLQRVVLGDLVHEARQELSPATQSRKITWQVGPLPAVEGDTGLLRLVFVNLLSNAIKYTGPRSEAHIDIGARSGENGDMVIFVRDNGVGFDSHYVHKLFGVFQRLHRDEEFEGTGIGLATVRRIIHRHGGRVGAESELDHGATFWFSLRAA